MSRSAALPSILIAFSTASPVFAATYVKRCPRGTVPVRTADARMPWSCIIEGERYQSGIDCPQGFRPVTTTDPLDPFRCGKTDIQLKVPRGICPPGHRVIPTNDPDRDYDCERIKKGFDSGPRCPRGTIPVPTPGALRPFRCVRREKSAATEPLAAPDFGPQQNKKERSGDVKPTKEGCPKSMRLVRTENPFDPVKCVPRKREPVRHGSSQVFRIRGQISFLYPKKWHLTNAWKDEDVPTIFLAADTGGDGRPVSITISRQRRGSPSYIDLATTIQREKEWHNAVEKDSGEIAGLPAKFLIVPNESKTAFLTIPDGYYAIAFSAAPDQYDSYADVYDKLLESFKHYTGSKDDD
ncbi:MAG: hypothetical protein ABIJ96_13270 [Elusimicrobiota bacterium]